ncbi:peptidylprolyl isomerase [Sphingomonas jejuensis]|nr:peptidylprolyl isomerase [Sphingomonas jejuensis]
MAAASASSALVIGIAASGAAVPALAQEAPASAPAADAAQRAALDIPADVVLFGNDTAVRKPTAVINGEIITRSDVDHRLALTLLANQGQQIPQEEIERLRLQVLRNLIDEMLQIQEARANEITVSAAEIQQSYDRVAQNFRRTPAQLDAYLRENNSSDTSLKQQIHAELAWSRLLRRRIEPTTNVGEAEVQAIVDRLNAARGTSEYRVGEIYLASTPATQNETIANAQRIMQQLQQGASFAAYARQFSEASTAAVGGDLGWVRAEQLPDPLANQARQMQVGQLAGPIPVPGGLSILYLIDQRQVLTADPRDAVLNLRQVAISFPPNVTQAQLQARANAFADATRNIQGCGAVDAIARQLNAEIVDNDQVRVRDLPVQLQQTMLNLQVGSATPPFGSPEDGLRVLVLCGRDDPEVTNEASRERIATQLEQERVGRRARRYLRDLRRDAVVDYR